MLYAASYAYRLIFFFIIDFVDDAVAADAWPRIALI